MPVLHTSGQFIGTLCSCVILEYVQVTSDLVRTRFHYERHHLPPHVDRCTCSGVTIDGAGQGPNGIGGFIITLLCHCVHVSLLSRLNQPGRERIFRVDGGGELGTKL